MTVYFNVMNATAENIRKARGISPDARYDSELTSKLHHRIALLFSLDVILNEYKTSFANSFMPVNGRDALVHKIMSKYALMPEAIRGMSFPDQLLAIADDLRPEKLPPKAQAVLKKLHLGGTERFLNLSSEEWAPENAEMLFAADLKQQQEASR